MTSFRINGHPSPIADESARGYLLRMVDCNGYKNVENICRKAGTKFAHKVHVMSKQWEQILSVFTPVLYKQDSVLMDIFKQHWAAKFYAKFDMQMSNLFSVNCRICPICIQGEDGYAHADWDFALSTVCTKHKCHLIETCPHCRESISWKRGKLDRCPECEKNYSSAPAIQLEKDSPLLKLHKHYATMNREHVEQLITVCARMYRPQDNMIACPSLHFMSLDEINLLLNQALGLMHSSSFRAKYQSWLDNTRAELAVISSMAVQEPYWVFIAGYDGKLDNLLPDITFLPPTDSQNIIDKKNIIKPTPESAALGIKAARLKNIRDDISVISLNTQIDAKRLASVLGVPFSSIQHMSDSSVLKPVNVVGTIRHYLFDLNDVAVLIKNVSAQKIQTKKGLISISSLANTKLLSKFALKFHHVIEIILQQKLSLFFDKNKEGFFDGSVCESELIKILEEMMSNNNKTLNINELSSILNTTPECIVKLSLRGVISVITPFTKNDSFTKSITQESLQNFFAQYISINRMSYFTGVRIDKTLRLLKEQSISPTITVNDGDTSLYLLKKVRS